MAIFFIMSTEKPNKETLEAWSRNPNNWIWGIFYYNKQDKRLLPPKKNPALGFTINFANRKSVLLFIFLIGFPLAVIGVVLLIVSLYSK